METVNFHRGLGELIAQSRGGDREAFGQIVRQYQRIVSGVTFGILGDFHKSEDIAQETFLVAWKKLDELSEIEKFPAWLCGIAKNLANQYRVKLPKIRVVPVSQTEEIAEHKNDPAELLAKQEQNRLIWGALEKIPEKYRIPLVLFYRSDQSVSEIAAALELSENALNVRLTRARKYLRKELEKQVAGTIADSGPGELFSLAVIAALPAVATMTSAGKTMIATVLGTESTLAAAGIVVAPKSGCGSASFSGMALFWNAVQPFVLAVGFIVSCFFWIIGATPGIWFSIRNAPTLRARRYLVLASLRAHLIFAVWCFGILFIIMFIHSLVALAGRPLWLHNLVEYSGVVCTILFGIITALFLIATPFRYHQIVREDAGIVTPKKPLPLEKSPLSFQRLERSFHRIDRTFRVMLVLICLSILLYVGRFVFYEQRFPTTLVLWIKAIFYDCLSFVLLGVLFLLVFRKVHRYFLAIVKDEEAFASAPPLVNRETPYWERAWIEWNVSFGLFLFATLVAFLTPIHFFLFNFPVGLFCILVWIFAGSFLTAMLSAVLPVFRWLINIAGALLIFLGVGRLFFLSLWKQWNFLDSPQDWPVVYGAMILDLLVFLAAFMLLLYGGLCLKRKWSNQRTKSHLGRKLLVVYCVGAVLIVAGATFFHHAAKYNWFFNTGVIYLFRSHDQTSDGVQKGAAFFCEAMRLTPILSTDFFVSYHILSNKLMQCQEKYPAAAIAGYDQAIAVFAERGEAIRTNLFYRRLVHERGSVKFFSGDYRGAVEDFSIIADQAPYPEFLYNRGYAHEKLGETDAAIADYSKAITIWEEKLNDLNYRIETYLPRSDLDEKTHRIPDGNQYTVSLEELKAIRDQLQKSE
ncbi:MAG: sigma-70 family RNA polymerase sigma factor [Planctomycetaceae bacterium]|nr:sigma-70 family RNA polymerase sigma factor [Planctomycetaceae bacterium]